MDKTERIIDMTEHPERYSEDEIRELLVNDDEGRRIYKTISELNVAFTMEERKHDDNTFTVNILFWKKTAAVFIGICLLSGIAYAAVSSGLFSARQESKVEAVANTTAAVSTQQRQTPVAEPVKTVKTYEDVTLEKILADIAATYGMTVEYKSDKARLLRLYFKFDAARGLEKTIGELNTFENINISIQEKNIIVE